MGRCTQTRQKLLDAALKLFWERSYFSVSVEDICSEAGVRKGSFYHFFESKAELAAEAIEFHWQSSSTCMCSTFAKSVPPLDRLKNYMNYGYMYQKEMKEKTGYAVGCPYFDLGSEAVFMKNDISARVTNIIGKMKDRFREAIEDARAEGSLETDDPAKTAEWLFSFMEGALTNARIHNDPEILKDLYNGAFRLIGVK